MNRLTMTRASSASFAATIATAGTPDDLTGGKVFFTVKSSPLDEDASAIFQKSWIAGTPNGIDVADATTGALVVNIAPADTASLEYTPRSLVWDLRFVTPGGDVFTVDSGTLSVQPNVTRSS